VAGEDFVLAVHAARGDEDGLEQPFGGDADGELLDILRIGGHGLRADRVDVELDESRVLRGATRFVGAPVVPGPVGVDVGDGDRAGPFSLEPERGMA